MAELQDVIYGWDFMSKMMGVDLAGQRAYCDYTNNVMQNQQIGIQNQHIKEINDAIDSLAKSINEHPHLNLEVEQFKGYVAEEFAAGTFNVDALRKGSSHMAFTLQDNGYGSVDIGTNFGKKYSLKYANYADKSESYQAVLNKDTGLPKYAGQELLIAPEQVDDAKVWAARRAATNRDIRPNVSESHEYAKEHLVGTISDGEGTESKPLSVKEAKSIASEAKNTEFDPEKHGIKKEQYLVQVRVDYLNQAMKAGLTSATITAITQLVPELYKAIDYLIKHGEINVNQLKVAGSKIISTSGEAFLRGSIAYGVEMAIQEGLFGETLKAVNPSVIGVMVSVVLGTIKNSIYVATGKMTTAEMGMQFIDNLVVSSGYLVSMKIGGMIAQTLFPQLPGIGFAIGSLLGCSIAVVYNIGKKKLISFCVDTGFTCFGLVEQNYELPDEVLKELGIDTVKIRRAKAYTTQVAKTEPNASVDSISYETVNMTVLRRGVIGVNKIGYVI